MSFFERIRAAEPESSPLPAAKSRWFVGMDTASSTLDGEEEFDDDYGEWVPLSLPPSTYDMPGETFSSRFSTPQSYAATQTPATPALEALPARHQAKLAAGKKPVSVLTPTMGSPARTVSTATESFQAPLDLPGRRNSSSTCGEAVDVLAEQLEGLDVVMPLPMQRSSPMAVPQSMGGSTKVASNHGDGSAPAVNEGAPEPAPVSASMVDALLAARDHAGVQIGASKHYHTAFAAYDWANDSGSDRLSGGSSSEFSEDGSRSMFSDDEIDEDGDDDQGDEGDEGVFDFEI